MPAPKDVTRLIDQFERNADAYRAPGYNETACRREFIDPFFKCLGWDIDNTQGFAEAYKDVIHEGAIKIGGATKAPDYCFRVGGRLEKIGLQVNQLIAEPAAARQYVPKSADVLSDIVQGLARGAISIAAPRTK